MAEAERLTQRRASATRRIVIARGLAEADHRSRAETPAPSMRVTFAEPVGRILSGDSPAAATGEQNPFDRFNRIHIMPAGGGVESSPRRGMLAALKEDAPVGREAMR